MAHAPPSNQARPYLLLRRPKSSSQGPARDNAGALRAHHGAHGGVLVRPEGHDDRAEREEPARVLRRHQQVHSHHSHRRAPLCDIPLRPEPGGAGVAPVAHQAAGEEVLQQPRVLRVEGGGHDGQPGPTDLRRCQELRAELQRFATRRRAETAEHGSLLRRPLEHLPDATDLLLRVLALRHDRHHQALRQQAHGPPLPGASKGGGLKVRFSPSQGTRGVHRPVRRGQARGCRRPGFPHNRRVRAPQEDRVEPQPRAVHQRVRVCDVRASEPHHRAAVLRGGGRVRCRDAGGDGV